ncbi:thioredoxin domain-containing protein [Acidomonas methanolica]|uniref:methylamine utilization protein MauD n=1 Tax=Acidomonas methanolica TaxID=437 RepID=UPI00211A844B|nr:methylamine utilization protein MauD [Acidomonas methanolica]MCQ9155783.1 methylamine utilization protein MauD [Acidomonas methanolica]
MIAPPPVSSLLAGEIALYAGTAALGGVMLMLRRRLRAFGRRVIPAGALTTSGGPPRGAALGTLTANALDGRARTLASWPAPLLLLFVSDSCPISRKLIPIARTLARAEKLTLVLAGEEEAGRQERFAARVGQPKDTFLNDGELGRILGVDKLPYAFLLDTEGTLVARGLVNSREHLESLVISGELKVASLQSYLSEPPTRSAA